MQKLSARNVYMVTLVSLILGLLFNYFFFDKIVGISFFAYIIVAFAVIFFLFKRNDFALKNTVWWYVVPILFFSGMVGIRDSIFLMFWNFVMVLGLLLLLARELTGKNAKDYILLDYLKTGVIFPVKFLGRAFNAMGRMVFINKNIQEGQKIFQVIKGVLITLPVIFFFVVLLSSADLVFNRLVSNIFNFSLNEETKAQIFIVGVITFIWLGLSVYILENRDEKQSESRQVAPASYWLGNIEANILFGSLNVLFLIFVAIQIRYLFAGHDAVTRLGFTYAEYARRGFAELIFTALLTFGLIYFVDKFIQPDNKDRLPVFKVLAGASILLVMVIMASGFVRLNVYESAYSFTLMRFLVQAFIIWLAIVFLWLFYKIISGLEERRFFFGILISVLAFFAILNILNPDAFIAKKNIEQFAKNGKLDTKYIFSLSADSVPAIVPLLEMESYRDKYGEVLSRVAARELKDRKLNLEESRRYWQSNNLSRNNAFYLIEDKWGLIESLSAKNE